MESIKQYVSKLNRIDRIILTENIQNSVYCPFRTEKKCLIHEVRPMNCIWTPYQLAQNIYTGEITYCMINEECDFEEKRIKHEIIDANNEFIIAKSNEKDRCYIFLNNFIINYEDSDFKYYNLSEIINQFL